jgi:ribosomal protein S12 methylthiotransferase
MDRRDSRSLAALLRDLSEIPGLRWIRILYAYPSYFTDELINEIANNPKVRHGGGGLEAGVGEGH